jgi:glycosyltransferase involved in cell wall biosynthesis
MNGEAAKRRIRVLHPITRLIVGGAQENTLFTAARLDRDRYQAEVLCGPQTGSEGSLIGEARAQGISLEILPELLRQVSPLNDWRALKSMSRIMRQKKYQIVHTHSSKAGILGRLAAWQVGVPVIIHTVHGWSFHPHMPALTRFIYVNLERMTARISHALVAVSRCDIEKGLRAHIGKTESYHLIRSAIPLEDFDPGLYDQRAIRLELGLPADAPVLGNIGRFSAQKNPLEWLRVAEKVAQQLPECRFLLVGDGPLRQQVEVRLAQEGLKKKTILTGLRRDVPRMLAAMDVFLLTSLWEGLPRVIPQALAMRLPVVANQVDGVSEALSPGENGFLGQPGDPDTLARYCLDLFGDPRLRMEMGQHGQEFARREFDLSKMVHQIDRLYRECLEARS